MAHVQFDLITSFEPGRGYKYFMVIVDLDIHQLHVVATYSKQRHHNISRCIVTVAGICLKILWPRVLQSDC